MHIGIDFDNTIACYDDAFYAAAIEKGLIPNTVGQSKTEVRDYLRSVGREQDWTALQGYIYGARMDLASPFPGVLDFLKQAKLQSVPVTLISHKTKTPFAGPPYDLHMAAKQWLKDLGFEEFIPKERMFFELTKSAKLARIGREGCSHFIDDLPELLTEPSFPTSVVALLFDPNNAQGDVPTIGRILSWKDALSLLG